MYLDYQKIKSGQIAPPVLRLQTLAGKELGVIPYAHNICFEINYADVSTIEFDVPYSVSGAVNPIYSKLSSYKVVYTENYGIYILMSPNKTGDGVKEVKHVTGYSLEQLFAKKMLYLEEGTYNFWDPIDRKDTLLGRILELDPSWSIGYVDPKLIGCYRTFDEYNSDALTFCYQNTAEKYRCTIVFDVYSKTINAYDAGKSRGTLPIYLSYKNLLEEVKVEELTDEIVTKLHLYGADDLNIRDVNPAGTDYLIDLSYFIANGDLDITAEGSAATLAERYRLWQKSIVNRQPYYTGLISARASKTAQKIAQEVQLTQLKGELETLTAQQSVIIQAIALEKTDAGKAAQQSKLDDINRQMDTKQNEIDRQEKSIETLNSELSSYGADIQAVNKEVSFQNFFTQNEQRILNHYLIESEMTEETFVATEVDATVSGTSGKKSGSINLTGSDIAEVGLSGKRMYALTGGALEVANKTITGNLIRGTLEVSSSNNLYIMSAYLGTLACDGKNYPSGVVTLSGTLSQFSSDISSVTEHEVTQRKGTRISFQTTDSDVFFTANTNDYQKYSVAKELYDFGVEVLEEAAWPIYEFTLSSANFLFHKSFEPFKDKLELGKAVYLDLGSDGLVEANIIGFSLDFEKPTDFSLHFSNRYQLKNGAETLWTELQKASASSRKFDASKYLYNIAANKTTALSEFIENDRDAAVQRIIGAKNQTVIINGAGIQIGGDSKYQLRMVDNMIAMSDDGWKTAKLAIGLFSSELGTHWGVNTDLLAGKLIIGNSVVLENANDKGVMQFKVDSSGAWLYNSTFVLQNTNGGLLILDPDYGIVGGPKALFNTNGTTVTPEFIDKYGDITYDSDGMPQNANFYLDIRDGNAYFRGRICATSGSFSGELRAATGTFSGELKAATGTFNGDISASSGTFKGTIQAARYLDSAGNNMMTNGKFTASYLDLKGLNINNRFIVDSNGNVTINGGSISWGAVTGTTEIDNRISNAQSTANSAKSTANSAYDLAGDAYDLANANKLPSYIKSTKITQTTIESPTIRGGTFYGNQFNIISESSSGGLTLKGMIDSRLYDVFEISFYNSAGIPYVNIYSPDSGNISISGNISFSGSINFSGADVYGLDTVATFG